MVDWQQAISILSGGNSIAYPTDTLWGLGCRADDPSVVRACLALKGERRHPLASVVVCREWLDDLVIIPRGAEVDALLPGPYTLILPLKSKKFAHLAGPQRFLGCRIPALAPLDQLVCSLGVPIVSTSLNLHGQPPAHQFFEAQGQARRLDIPIIDCDLTLPGPSTVLQWSDQGWECLRQGLGPPP